MRIFLVFILVVICNVDLFAQKSRILSTDTALCVPGIINMPRPKGISITREMISDYRITSRSGQDVNTAEVLLNRRWEFKLRFPVLLKKKLKVAAGFTYGVEEFRFANSDNLDFAFYKQLENRSLKRLAGSIYIVRPFRGNKYLVTRINGSFNGDFVESVTKRQFLKLSVTPLLGWKKSDDLAYGVGFSLNYRFGQKTLVPVFFLDRNLGRRWTLQTLLPVMAKLRYGTDNAKNYFFLKTELDGANYNIDLEKNGSLLFLNNSELRYTVRYEREIHDWLWMGIESGYRTNFNFDLSTTHRRNTVPVIENDFKGAFLVNLSIFVVTPRKFYK